MLPGVFLFRVVGSTNDVAGDLAREGCGSGTLALAEEQRAGRGRGSRTWESPPGVGLWCSLIGRDLPAAGLASLPLRVAHAVAGSLDPWLPGAVRVKWPNDLLVRGRKLGGILCEASWDGGRLQHVVVGIGLNLLQGADDFPPGLRTEATSVRLEVGRPISRFRIATEVVSRVRELLDGSDGSAAAFTPLTFAGRDALEGRQIEVLEPESGRILVAGTACGVDHAGSLLVSREGAIVAVRSGTVRLLDPPT
jgi:BirA family transcriptional regulator, biotin operon repressor / biotin---[acetyl-CoA-carboxylase] ligase